MKYTVLTVPFNEEAMANNVICNNRTTNNYETIPVTK